MYLKKYHIKEKVFNHKDGRRILAHGVLYEEIEYSVDGILLVQMPWPNQINCSLDAQNYPAVNSRVQNRIILYKPLQREILDIMNERMYIHIFGKVSISARAETNNVLYSHRAAYYIQHK